MPSAPPAEHIRYVWHFKQTYAKKYCHKLPWGTKIQKAPVSIELCLNDQKSTHIFSYVNYCEEKPGKAAI